MTRLEVPLVVQQRAKRLAEQLEQQLDALHPSVGGSGCDLAWLEADAPRMLRRLAEGDGALPEQTCLGTRAAGVLGDGPAVSGLLDVLFEVDRMVRGFRQSENGRPVDGDGWPRPPRALASVTPRATGPAQAEAWELPPTLRGRARPRTGPSRPREWA